MREILIEVQFGNFFFYNLSDTSDQNNIFEIIYSDQNISNLSDKKLFYSIFSVLSFEYLKHNQNTNHQYNNFIPI